MAKKKQHGGKRKGAGRKATDDPAVVVAVSVPESLAKRLKAHAAKEGRGVSAIAVDALGAYLKRKGA
jgi:hypothetical protein